MEQTYSTSEHDYEGPSYSPSCYNACHLHALFGFLTLGGLASSAMLEDAPERAAHAHVKLN